MQKALLFIVALFNFYLVHGQSFEGKLTFKVEFDIKTQKIGGFEITEEQVIDKLNSEGKYFDTLTVTIKEGNYITEDNSSLENKVIYKSDLNRLYSFERDSGHETITDAYKYNALNLDVEKPRVEKIDTVKVINGVDCHLLRLSWDGLGEEYYFYNSEMARLDPKLFEGHNYDYFNTVVGHTNSYPLEIIKRINGFIEVRMTCVSVSEEIINDELFDIEKIKLQKSLYLQNRKTNWSLFEDDTIGYSVEYPENWIPHGSKGGFRCGRRSGFVNAEFTIWWSKARNRKRFDFLFNDEGLFDGYDVVEKPITINGIDGVYYLKTHKERPNEYHESIVLKTKSTWYLIGNSGIKNEWFEHFYKSFRLIR